MADYRFRQTFHHVVGDRSVDFTRQVNESSRKVILLCFPRQIERIDRYAVTAESWPRIEGLISEWLAARRVDYFPDINVHSMGQKLQFVNERDIHCPVDVLEQFNEFGSFGRGNGHDSIDNLLVERLAHFEAIWGRPTNNLGNRSS